MEQTINELCASLIKKQDLVCSKIHELYEDYDEKRQNIREKYGIKLTEITIILNKLSQEMIVKLFSGLCYHHHMDAFFAPFLEDVKEGDESYVEKTANFIYKEALSFFVSFLKANILLIEKES